MQHVETWNSILHIYTININWCITLDCPLLPHAPACSQPLSSSHPAAREHRSTCNLFETHENNSSLPLDIKNVLNDQWMETNDAQCDHSSIQTYTATSTVPKMFRLTAAAQNLTLLPLRASHSQTLDSPFLDAKLPCLGVKVDQFFHLFLLNDEPSVRQV